MKPFCELRLGVACSSWREAAGSLRLQDFDGQAAYAPFHEATFRQRLPHSSAHELGLMQQMLDWREAQVVNEISLLDAAQDNAQGKRQHIQLTDAEG